MASFAIPVSRNSSMTRLSHIREKSVGFKTYGKFTFSTMPKTKR